jgi:uncharacterized membrane protein YhaH (DUF805 family)
MTKMKFSASLIQWLKHWFRLDGRLSRLEYISTQVVNFWLMVCLMSMFSQFGWEDTPVGMSIMLLFGVSASVLTLIKRNTDMGKDFSHITLSFMPIICVYYWLEPLWRPGTLLDHANETLPAQRFSKIWQAFHWWILIIGFVGPVLWVVFHITT